MTDEELADVLMQAYDKKPGSWISGPAGDENPETRHTPRVREHWRSVVERVRHRLESSQREQMAATILAALIQFSASIKGGPPPVEQMIPRAVGIADELRARLAKS